jgi:cytochrome c oxidase assembly factor CtaG
MLQLQAEECRCRQRKKVKKSRRNPEDLMVSQSPKEPQTLGEAMEAPDDVKRIMPLGLTQQEATAWYRNTVVMPHLISGLLVLTIASGIILSMLMITKFNDYLESTLTMHMVVQHLLYIMAGFLSAYGIDLLILAGTPFSRPVSRVYTKLLRANATVNKRGIVTFAVASILVAYWHVPFNFDAAVLNEGIHVEMHLTFLVVGGLIFIGSKLLTKRTRHIAPIIAGKAMGLFGAFLLFTTSYVYPVYSLPEQAEAGLAMVVMMLVMDLTLVPIWLYGYFGKPISPYVAR